MTTIVHDVGVMRLPCDWPVEKGKWYIGFRCPHCQSKLFCHPDETGGNPNRCIGAGKFSVPCRTCGVDEILLDTDQLISLCADEDGPPPRAVQRRKPSNRPRQPVKTRYPSVKPTFGASCLENRPECAIIVARCISLWSYIESALSLLLASIIKVEAAPAAAIFLTIQNSRTQQQVLIAAAETVLSADDLDLLIAVMNAVASCEKQRNDLAHGLFGKSMLVEDGVLWTSVKNLTQHTVDVWSSNYEKVDDKNFNNQIYVYEPEDLETIATKFEWLHTMIGFIRGYLWSDNPKWRTARYHELCSDKIIATELAAIQAKRKKIEENNPPVV